MALQQEADQLRKQLRMQQPDADMRDTNPEASTYEERGTEISRLQLALQEKNANFLVYEDRYGKITSPAPKIFAEVIDAIPASKENWGEIMGRLYRDDATLHLLTGFSFMCDAALTFAFITG